MRATNKKKSLRKQIVIATTVFSVAISIAVSFFFFMLSSYYTKRTKLQSIEFNLALIASTVNTNIQNAERLLAWSGYTNSINTYLTTENLSAEQIMRAYDAANTAYNANPSQQQVTRFFITNEENRFLQFGKNIIASQPLTSYTVNAFPFIGSLEKSYWQIITSDPLIPSHPASLIAYMPIYADINSPKIGSAYMALDLCVITDPLCGYTTAAGSSLYWKMGDTLWSIKEDVLTPLNFSSFHTTEPTASYGLSENTILQEMERDGETYWLVQLPLATDGLSIAQSIPTRDLQVSSETFALAILGSLFFIALMSLLLLYWLNGTVSRPIAHLQRRLRIIGQGDFNADPSIEWNTELGDIGRGINQLSVNVESLMAHRLEAQRQHQELEYRMLQNEINPHFIYNTLNSIHWMATIQHATGISEMVKSLSRLLKSISKSNEKLVCLQDELALLNDYFLIQQYRYGGDLEMDVSYIEDEAICRDCYIPRFTLQPIAENAIFHGLEPAGSVGSILLNIRYDAQDVLIQITDNGVGMNSAQCQSALAAPTPEQASEKFRHVGLWNVHKRVQYAFGDSYGLSLKSELGIGTTVTIRLPAHPTTKEIS